MTKQKTTGHSISLRPKPALSVRNINQTILVGLNGVGWNSSVKGNTIFLNVGYSHPVIISVPDNITVVARNETTLEVQSESTNLTKLGDFVSKILRVRRWNCYSGHGIIRMDRTDQLARRRGKRLIF